MEAARFQTIEKYYPENIRIDVFKTLMNKPIRGIPRIVSINETGNGWRVVEEFIPGTTLANRLQGGLFTKKNAVNICLQLCDILQQLHSYGIVHGDIKPENIIIGANGLLYLIDFDASHFTKDELGRDTVMMGTPGYASPEQFGFGRSDPRSDIYAIGVLLNVMMTGRHPLYQMPKGRISIVVERCTDVDPERRYQTIKELKRGLRHPVKRFEFLPVGFRSLSPGKMFLAIVGYAAIFGIGFAIKPTYDWEVKGFIVFRWTIIVLLIGWIFIFFNYGGVNNIFSRNKHSKHVGAKFLEAFLYLILVAILMLLAGVVFDAW